jgi:hypothetical protein
MGGSRKTLGISASDFNISLLRSLDHTVRAWLEIAIGVIGGWLLLRGQRVRRLGPLWIAWIALICSEALSSGAGWGVLYHFGPGVTIGAIWMFAALPRYWPSARCLPNHDYPRTAYAAWVAAVIIGTATIFVALGVVPTGHRLEPRYVHGRQPSADVYRYIADIEHEFEGFPSDRVLLDVGNWIYLRESVLMRDRAVSLADQPPGGIYENLDVMVDRVRARAYDKILVRNMHSPFFLYDWADWPRPSGVREALATYYTEVRVIPAPQGDTGLPPVIMFTGPVSVLVPAPEAAARLDHG